MRHTLRGGHTQARRAWQVLVLLGGLVWGMVALPVPAQQAAPQWGQKLLHTFDVPPAVLEQWGAGGAAAAPVPPDAGTKPPSQAQWRSPALALTTEGSPYTVVFKVGGAARSDGEAALQLRVGWAFDGSTHPLMLPAMKQPSAHAGQALELTGVSIPVTMKQDREAVLVIESGSTANLQPARVQVEVWSGMGNVTMGNSALSWLPLLLGLGFVAFMVWLRRQ